MKSEKEIKEQLKDLENAKLRNDVTFRHYTAYKDALNWVLGNE